MRALKNIAALTTVCLGILLGACAEDVPEQLSLDVGAHKVAIDAPIGWEHLDRGTEQFFRSELAQIFLNDAGPATVQGFQREVERARDVFRGGSIAEANDILNALRWRSSFPSKERWQAFYASLKQARGLGAGRQHHDPDAVESAYRDILLQLATLPERDLATLATEVLADFEPLDRRTVREQRPMIVDGRRALLIETWDRLNHIQPMRYIFVVDDGRILVLRTGLGQFSDIEPAFEAVVTSLTFRDPVIATQ